MPRPCSPSVSGVSTPIRLALICVLAMVASLAVNVPVAQAQSYTIYVAPNGSDANSGTKANPKATIAGAMQALPQGGDILMRGGTYWIRNSSSTLWRGGTPQRPLVVKSAPGERAKLISTAGNHCVRILEDYTRVRNIDCTGAAGIRVGQASHVIVYGNYIHDLTDNATQGILVTGDVNGIIVRKNTVHRVPHGGILIGNTRVGTARNIVVDKNEVREASSQYRWRSGYAGGWGSGISVVGATDVRITKNDVRRTYGEGINCPLSNRCTVRRNKVADVSNAAYYADNTTNSVWEDNVAKHSGNTRYMRDFGHGPVGSGAFVFANEYGWYSGPRNPPSGNIVRNNVVIGMRNGFGFRDDGSGRGINTTRVANNTFVNVHCGTIVDNVGANWGNEFVNNIVVPVNGGRPVCHGTQGFVYRNNLWASGNAGSGAHPSDVKSNPGFTRGTGLKASSYRLSSSSAAIDAGRTVSYVSDDKRKRLRPRGSAYDIGAFEY